MSVDSVTTKDNAAEKLPFTLPAIAGCQADWLADKQGYKITIPNGALLYIPNFLNDKEVARAIAYLLATTDVRLRDVANVKGIHQQYPNDISYTNIPWKQEHIAFFQQKKALPRLTSWHGDADKPYTYSGIQNLPAPWNPCLLYIKNKVQQVINKPFNSVLLNWYRDASDSIGWHSDDEKALGRNPIIASVSIGEERAFLVRNKFDHTIKFDIKLASGSLLIMAGEMQDFWQHSIAKQSKPMGSRINMTFRNIVAT